MRQTEPGSKAISLSPRELFCSYSSTVPKSIWLGEMQVKSEEKGFRKGGKEDALNNRTVGYASQRGASIKLCLCFCEAVPPFVTAHVSLPPSMAFWHC